MTYALNHFIAICRIDWVKARPCICLTIFSFELPFLILVLHAAINITQIYCINLCVFLYVWEKEADRGTLKTVMNVIQCRTNILSAPTSNVWTFNGKWRQLHQIQPAVFVISYRKIFKVSDPVSPSMTTININWNSFSSVCWSHRMSLQSPLHKRLAATQASISDRGPWLRDWDGPGVLHSETEQEMHKQ